MRTISLSFILILFSSRDSRAEKEYPSFIRVYVHDHYVLSYDSSDLSNHVYSNNQRNNSLTHTSQMCYGDRPASLGVRDNQIWIDYHFSHALGGMFAAPAEEEAIRIASADTFCLGRWDWTDIKPRLTLDLGTWWGEFNETQSKRISTTRKESYAIQSSIVPVSERTVLRFELLYDPKSKTSGQMNLYRIESHYDAEKKLWTEPDMKFLEKFDTEFAEPFQAVLMGNDCVFITISGKAFRFDVAGKGTPRKSVEEKWPGPIVGLVTNTNAPNSHYAIGRKNIETMFYISLAKESKPTYFKWVSRNNRNMTSEVAMVYTEILLRKEFSLPDPSKKK